VVRVVLVLPPLHGEAEVEGADEHAEGVVEAAVVEDGVVREVVAEPAALLQNTPSASAEAILPQKPVV
jgi:hypothetical protein